LTLIFPIQKGKQTEYEIGKYLRKTYGQLIPEQYSPDVIYAISMNLKRTKMSLELVLASLFPPLLTEFGSPDLNWQPIPFNIEQAGGILGVASSYCANYINAYFQYVLSKVLRLPRQEMQEVFISPSKAK
jgi:prostatic aicd phosphatase